MSHALIAHFRMMAQYNSLANARLYECCAGLSDDDRKKDRKAFFRSIHGTLNHILVGDRIWLARFEGSDAPSTGLDAILYEDFGDLHEARNIQDAKIETFFERFDEAALAKSVRYQNNQGIECDDPMDILVPHFFNHQTHHRGQVHDLLCQAEADAPVLDLHRVLRPT